ncbi:acyltransferase [Spiroplasma chinense]|uniref:Acyltransferase n=1 Tax=Spiroplasma chinense TaxID=216932 RepID=A0A5B9Y2G4_9MOLU|nr:acyltransferase [Spiroplasma chinense]QEH61254.1 acyltransferase [Spiroplasma chinense]
MEKQVFKINENNIKEVKTKRSSNIELLRIFMAICVLVIHFLPSFQANIPFLHGCVGAFAMISGYYLVEKKDNLRFLKFIPTIVFLYVINLSLVLIFNFSSDYKIFSTRLEWIKFLQLGTGPWWYIYAVFILYIFTPFFNAGLKVTGKKVSLILIISFWLTFQIQALLLYSYRPFTYIHNALPTLFFSYLLGGWLKLFGQNVFNYKKTIWISTIVYFLVQLGFHLLYVFLYPQKDDWFDLSKNNGSLLSFGASFFLFASFKIMPMKNYKFIDFLGSISLFIFALHMSTIWFSKFFFHLFGWKYNSDGMYSLASAITFLISLLIYWPYKKYMQGINFLTNKFVQTNFYKKLVVDTQL